MTFYYRSLKSSKHPIILRLKQYCMLFKKVKVTLNFPKCHLKKLLLARYNPLALQLL